MAKRHLGRLTVLPSWTDRLHIFLGPRSVDLVRYSGGLKPKELMRANQLCREAKSNEAIWLPAIEAFEQLMFEQSGHADAYVYLSSHFVNYLRVQDQEGLSTRDEEEAYVRFCFSEIFGAQSEQFILSWSGDVSMDPQVASAVDKQLLSAIDRTLEPSSVICRSIQPNFMTGFNLLVKDMAQDTQWYVFVEHGQVVISYFLNGVCKSIRKARLSDHWRVELPRLLVREFNATELDLKQGSMMISVPDHMDARSLSLDGWNVKIVKLDQTQLLTGHYVPVGIMEKSHAAP